MLVSKDLAQHARNLQVGLGRFLFFFPQLKANAVLVNGAHLGRGLPQVAD